MLQPLAHFTASIAFCQILLCGSMEERRIVLYRPHSGLASLTSFFRRYPLYACGDLISGPRLPCQLVSETVGFPIVVVQEGSRSTVVLVLTVMEDIVDMLPWDDFYEADAAVYTVFPVTKKGGLPRSDLDFLEDFRGQS